MAQLVTTISISSSGKYSYSPNSLTVTQSNTMLVYQLDEKTSVDWEIVGQTNTDSKQQITGESKAPSGNSISIMDSNSKPETFSVTIVTQHRAQRDRLLRVDPDVTNEPT
jgi:hypothetical protein